MKIVFRLVEGGYRNTLGAHADDGNYPADACWGCADRRYPMSGGVYVGTFEWKESYGGEYPVADSYLAGYRYRYPRKRGGEVEIAESGLILSGKRWIYVDKGSLSDPSAFVRVLTANGIPCGGDRTARYEWGEGDYDDAEYIRVDGVAVTDRLLRGGGELVLEG